MGRSSYNRNRRKQIVLMIHGTGSYSPDDEYSDHPVNGHRWWQRGSSWCEQLKSRLAGTGVELPEAGLLGRLNCMDEEYPYRDAFVWSGANLESDRRKAAVRLRKLLRSLDLEGFDVHLVAHSHGGSIIRQMLLDEGTRKENRTENIRSISTMGTPYLRFGPSPFGFQWFWGIVLVATITLWPMRELLHTASQGSGLFGYETSESGYSFLTELRNANDAITSSYSPLIYGPLLPIIAALVYMVLQFAEYVSLRCAQTKEDCVRDHQDKWLTIFSDSDEAINGLKIGTKTDLQMTPRTGPSWWDPFGFYDKVVAPMIDQFINETARAKAVGRNVAGESACDVSVVPAYPWHETPSVEQDWQLDLRAIADDSIPAAITEARDRFEAASQEASDTSRYSIVGADRLKFTLGQVLSSNGTELVHNQYMHVEQVVQRVVVHIEAAASNAMSAKAPDRDLTDPGFRVSSSYFRARWGLVLAIAAFSLIPLTVLVYARLSVKSKRVVVGCKAFDESRLAAAIFAKRLEQDGFDVVVRDDFRSDDTHGELFARATYGEIDVYMDYTGTLFDVLTGEELDYRDEPLFEVENGKSTTDPTFPEWFRDQRRKRRVPNRVEVGDWLEFSSPYLLVMRRESDLFDELECARVIQPIEPTDLPELISSVPDISVEHKLVLSELKTWLNNDAVQKDPPLKIRFGLSPDLGEHSSIHRMLKLTGTGDRIPIYRLSHSEKYRRLESDDSGGNSAAGGEIDIIDGYGTDAELHDPQTAGKFVVLLLFSTRTEAVAELAMTYQAMPVVSGDTPFRRAAILKTVNRPINAKVFSEALRELKELRADQTEFSDCEEPNYQQWFRTIIENHPELVGDTSDSR